MFEDKKVKFGDLLLLPETVRNWTPRPGEWGSDLIPTLGNRQRYPITFHRNIACDAATQCYIQNTRPKKCRARCFHTFERLAKDTS